MVIVISFVHKAATYNRGQFKGKSVDYDGQHSESWGRTYSATPYMRYPIPYRPFVDQMLKLPVRCIVYGNGTKNDLRYLSYSITCGRNGDLFKPIYPKLVGINEVIECLHVNESEMVNAWDTLMQGRFGIEDCTANILCINKPKPEFKYYNRQGCRPVHNLSYIRYAIADTCALLWLVAILLDCWTYAISDSGYQRFNSVPLRWIH